MKNQPAVSVIIPTFNSWKTLKECIKSIERQSLKPYEIIIVDNGSADFTSQKTKVLFPNVKLITLEKNSGVTGGRNKGIEAASSDSQYLLFFDHDMIANKNMLKELIKISDIDKNIGIVTPKIFYWEDRKRIWSAGTGINLLTGQVLFRGGKDKGQFEQDIEVQVAPAVLLVKKEVINKLKLFDNRYFATYEDTDFCFRAKKFGFKVFYSHLAIAFHKIPPDPRQEAIRLLSRVYWVGRNRILFMKDFGNNFYIFVFVFLPVFIIYYLRLALLHRNFSAWIKLLNGTISGLIMVSVSKKYIFSGERPSLSDLEGLHQAKYKFVLQFCKEKEVLEIGCGSGYGSKYLADNGAKKIDAYDLELSAINFAIKNFSHDNINFAQGNAETLTFKKKYDTIVSLEVIEHLNHPEKLLQLASKSLKKNGVFILSTPNKFFSTLDNGRPSNPYHIQEFYPEELREHLLKYFKRVELYGVMLNDKEKIKIEQSMHNSWRWRIANFLTNKRKVRKIMNYLPEYPKRLISGESKLSFQTDDFKVMKNKADSADDFVAVCR